MNTVKFEDIKPGLVIWKAYILGEGCRTNWVAKFVVNSDPYLHDNMESYFVDTIDDRGYKGFQSLNDMNIKTPTEKSQYNDHQAFYTMEDAVAYARNPTLLIEEQEEKSEIQKLREQFESDWETFTNDVTWEMYGKLTQMTGGQIFDNLETMIKDAFNKILDNMEAKK
ncbi:hypothetical protein BI036_gp083 [Morganella phage vB_MmoM_MP1]|uniref:Uncharacterized protein n=1 Tax=Morganella phage vB_MmoM_MP1 TaxID=1852628 RepID=A0A192YBJ9_9CAUD|nr:hypothetical protein BI036_gp083 [Morganella phage vB_MmoM_MP1]ANM46490.1 hypothetical protein MP1_gp0082 [Morganella phage vB_MmoM_MP1]